MQRRHTAHWFSKPTRPARVAAALIPWLLTACYETELDPVPDASPDRANAHADEPSADAGDAGDAGDAATLVTRDAAVADAGALDAAVDTAASTFETSAGSLSSSTTSSAPSTTLASSDSTDTTSDVSSEVASPPGAVVFEEDQILDLRFTLSEQALVNLEEHGNLEVYLPAQVTIAGNNLAPFSAAQVGLRHKGAYSLHHCFEDDVRRHDGECAKLSYKVKFDEFDSHGRFDGLKRLNLHASSGDGSKLRELLAYTTFAEFGVDAPRIGLARVTINDQLQGLFFAVEDIDGRYTQAHYPDGPNGNIYKQIWPVEAQVEEAYVAALQTNERAANVSDIRDFARAIDGATPETFVADMQPWVNIDNLVRYLVADRAMKNWDGIMAFYDPLTPHNFYWYHSDAPNGLFHLIPWDLDNTFWATDPYMTPSEWGFNVPPIPDWNVTPQNCDPRLVWDLYSNTWVTPPRCDKLLDLLAQTQWQHFVDLGQEFLDTVLEPTHLTARLDHWQTLMEPLVAEDPTLDAYSVAAEQTNLRYILDDITYDFSQYLSRGLTEEHIAPVRELLPPPTQEQLEAPGYASGIDPQRVTNFEFSDGYEGMPLPASNVISDDYSTITASWNLNYPLANTADARIDFVHNSSEGEYSEWVNLFLYADHGPIDISGYTQVEMTLRADKGRTVRIRIGGDASTTEFGGVWDEFGDYRYVDEYPVTVVLPLHDLKYPDWARNAWTEGQGWLPDDEPAALERVLATFWGLIFVPGADVDYYGNMIEETDPGFLEIDNIYFR